jgi:hypothetical protein
MACVHWHSARRTGYAKGPAGVMSARGRSEFEEDLATLSRRLSRRRREGACVKGRLHVFWPSWGGWNMEIVGLELEVSIER